LVNSSKVIKNKKISTSSLTIFLIMSISNSSSVALLSIPVANAQLPFTGSSIPSDSTTTNNQSSTSIQHKQQQFSTYTDPEGRFSIDYPSNWTVNPATNRFQSTVATFRPYFGGPTSLVQIINTPSLESSSSMSSLAARSVTRGLQSSGYVTFQDVECSKYTLSGEQACSMILTNSGSASLGTKSIAILTVVTIIDGKTYAVILGAGQDEFDSYLPTFENMLASFKLG
jgi:PsbP